MSKPYIVVWVIEVDADSPQGAAQEALTIQRDEESIATVFRVYDNSNNDAGIIGSGFTKYEIDFLDGSVTRLD